MSFRYALNQASIVEPLESRAMLSIAPIALPGSLGEFGNTAQVGEVYYYGDKAVYRTDGTAEGTQLLRDFDGSWVRGYTAIADTVYFFLSHEKELWRTDGTVEGTTLVKQIGGASIVGGSVAAYGSNLFFVSDSKLWTSDGTEAGTHLFLDSDEQPLSASNVYAVGDSLYFHDFIPPFTLWESDGTAAGTTHLGDLGGFMPPMSFTEFGGDTYFLAEVRALWKTDDTPAGTVAVKQIDALAGADMNDVNSLIRYQDRLLFFSTNVKANVTNTTSVWISDGTADGTVLLKTLPAENQAFDPTVIGGSVYFESNGSAGHLLWKTDGTEAGTRQVSTLPGSIHRMAEVDGLLFMVIDTRTDHTKPAQLVLWQSDGTAEGTYPAGQEVTASAPVAAALAARHADASGSAPSVTSFAIASTEPVVRILGRKAFVQVTDAQDTPRLYVMDLRPATRPADQLPTLVIKGTKRADRLYLAQRGDWLRYTLNGRTQRVQRSLFSTIEIRTSSGNDRILIGPGVTGVNADAGPGNDILIGTAAGNTLNGGTGNDLIIARSRANTLLGAAGNDILIAAGNDPRNGGAGKNRIYAKRLPNLPAITRPATLFNLPAGTSPAMLFRTVIEPRLAKRS